jgi:MFS family permease
MVGEIFPNCIMTERPSAGMVVLRTLLLGIFCVVIGWLAAVQAKLGMVPGVVTGAAIFGIGSFALLRLSGAPGSLWVTFGIKFFSVTAYKIVTVVLVSYLVKDCGLKDTSAQWLFGVWGMFMSVATLLSGSLTDVLGLRKTLLAGVLLCLVSRVLMLVSVNPYVVLVLGMVPLAVGEALCTPVLVAATRRFTDTSQRSVAFSVFYAILNLGFMVGYFIRDGVQQGGPVAVWGMEFSVQRVLFAVSFGIELLVLPLVLLMRDRSVEGLAMVPVAGFRAAVGQTAGMFRTLVEHPGFRRLLVFLLMIGILKIVFNIMDAVLPTFAEREIGGEGAARVGRLNAVNSILILVLAPAVGMMTRRYSAYAMVIFGGFITALSFVFLALPPGWFAGVTAGPVGEWIGRGYLELKGTVHPYLVMILFWQVVFSVGEAFYSPRVYEYAVAIAPKGQEASYAALSAVPLLMGKMINSALFGTMLARFCPAEGPRNSSLMWLIGGLLVLAAPLGLLVLQPYIRVKEEGR